MRTLILLLALATTTTTNFTAKPIQGNIFIEEIAKIHMYHDTWKLIIGINMTSTTDRIATISKTISLIKTACNNVCTPQQEIKLLENRFNRLLQKENILKKLFGRQRTKRGLINFVGDISKTLFGTLSNSDLTEINNEFDKIYNDNKQLAEVMTNHTKILKLILDSSSTNGRITQEEKDLARDMGINVNKNSQDSYINSKLFTAVIMIDETTEDMNTAIDAIADGKHGIPHPQILTPAILKQTIQDFEYFHKTRYHFDNGEENYQHLLDISEIKVAIIRGLFTYIIQIPVLEKAEGSLQHIIPIPEEIHNIHMSLIPNHDYIIKYKDSYIPTDLQTIQHCKEIDKYKICRRNQPDIMLYDINTCESSILKHEENIRCNHSPFLLHTETFIPLQTGYIVIPTKKFNLDILCDTNLKTLEINVATIITGSNCKLYNNHDILELNSDIEYHTQTWFNVTYDANFNVDDVNHLKIKLLQLPKQINNNELRQARISLDDAENILSNIAKDRRLRTWKETSLEYLQYTGYIALALGLLYVLQRIGLFEYLKQCIPSKFCFICIKNKVDVPHNVVTYHASVDTEPSAPILKHRRVKF